MVPRLPLELVQSDVQTCKTYKLEKEEEQTINIVTGGSFGRQNQQKNARQGGVIVNQTRQVVK